MINRRQEVSQQLEQHHKGNEQLKIALSSLITLASNAYDITDEKRQLLGYVFLNLELESSKLRLSLQKPFNLFADLTAFQDWLAVLNTIRTDYFKEIVDIKTIIPEIQSSIINVSSY